MGQANKLDSKESNLQASKTSAEKTLATKSFLWFVARGYVLRGPYSTSELSEQVASGEISFLYFAWRDGFKEWRPIYGIDDFNQAVEARESSAKEKDKTDGAVLYPTVPIPGQTQATEELPNPSKKLKDSPVFRVRFSRSRLGDLKKSDILLAFLFTLFFAYSVVNYSFTKFLSRWSNLWGAHSAGQLYQIGSAADALPVSWVAPILSAPGLKHQDEHWVAVEITGPMDRKNASRLGGYDLDLPLLSGDAIENMDWDQEHIYQRQMRAKGYINLKSPQRIEVEVEGMPFEPKMSARREVKR